MFWWLAQNTLLAGALALGAALAGRFGRLSPAVRHALWLLVLVKLVTPPVALYSLPESGRWSAWLAPGGVYETSPIDSFEADSQAGQTKAAKMDRLEFVAEESTAEIVEHAARMDDGRSVIDLGEWEVAAAPNELDVPAEDGPKSLRTSRGSANTGGPIAWPAPTYAKLRTVLFGVWAIGAVWMFLLQALRLLRFRRLLQNTAPAPRSLMALVEQIATQLVVAPPRVVMTSTACTPMIFGFGRPRLIWPMALAEPLEGDALRAVIAHELAHLRRRDHWVGWIELAASCGWWWNPLFWYVRRQLRDTAELACDAWVVALLPGGRRAYAQALIDVSEMISWTAAPAPAVGMGASARHLFERRLTMILRERVPCRAPLVGLALIGLLGVAVLPGWTSGQAPAPTDGNAKVGENKVEYTPQQRLPETKENPAISDSALRQSPAAETTTLGEDPLTDSQAAESLAPQAGLLGQAGPSLASGDDLDLALPIEARSVPAEHAQLRQIETLELRMAELAAELKALRGHEAAVNKQNNLHRIYVEHPKVAMAHTVTPEPRPAMVFDLPRDGNLREVQVHPAENQLIRLRWADKQEVSKWSFDPPERVEIVAKTRQELILMCLRAGKANATLWGNDGSRLIIHADVLAAAPGSAGDVETLTRAKYKLPPGRAQALAEFIQAQVKEDVETKVDGDMLVVTASSDDQTKIGHFIQLLKKTAERREAPEDRRDSPDDDRKSSDPFGSPTGVPADRPAPGIETASPKAPEANEAPRGVPLDSPGPSLRQN